MRLCNPIPFPMETPLWTEGTKPPVLPPLGKCHHDGTPPPPPPRSAIMMSCNMKSLPQTPRLLVTLLLNLNRFGVPPPPNFKVFQTRDGKQLKSKWSFLPKAMVVALLDMSRNGQSGLISALSGSTWHRMLHSNWKWLSISSQGSRNWLN